MGRYGDMEDRVADQAVTLAAAGIDVAVILGTATLLPNRYIFRMRRAGVRVVCPSFFLDAAMRAWMRAGGSGSPGILRTLARECASLPPDVIHIHGWNAGQNWGALEAILRLAATRATPSLYTEYAGARMENAGASLALAGKVIHATTIRHLSPRPKFAPACDAVLLSTATDGFAIALVNAMAQMKPIVVSGDIAGLPIRHRANVLATSTATAEDALRELREDPILAKALGVAARRTYETSGCRAIALTDELTAIYREIAPHAGR